eukprot:302856-Ditylum_brightwellii.AAC.1
MPPLVLIAQSHMAGVVTPSTTINHCNEFCALVAEVVDETIQDVGECVSLTNVEDVLQIDSFIAMDDSSAIVVHTGTSSSLTHPYNSGSNLPLAQLEMESENQEKSVYGAIMDLVVDEANVNLTQHEKILLCWHYKLGHFFFKWIQALMHKGHVGQPPVIPTSTNSRAHCCSTEGLLCSLCQCGKGAHIGSGTTH